jgi:hypothetical protein
VRGRSKAGARRSNPEREAAQLLGGERSRGRAGGGA